MKSYKYLGLVALAMMAVSPVMAQDVHVGTGGVKGNYYDMMNDIKSYCESDVPDTTYVVHETEGSTKNLLGMQNKEFSAGIIQEDVLNYYAKRDPGNVNDNRIKVISGLHEEAVHLLIPKGYKPSSASASGWKSWFSSDDEKPQKLDLNLLKGQTIGSWGGSIVSAEAMSYFFGLNLNVVEVPAADRANPNMPLLLVGGHPYQPVSDYLATGKWDLISLDYDAIANIAPFYNKANVNYSVGGKVKSTPTVSVRALLVGMSFRKESRNKPMSQLAACITGNVADLADDPETNPNWRSVYDFMKNNGVTKWAMFTLDEETLKKYE